MSLERTQVFRIHGMVQGVGYRMSLQQRAQALRLVGWVRNRRDGSVEAKVRGTQEALEYLKQWCYVGPPAAHVTQVLIQESDEHDLPTTFEVWPTL